MKRSLLVIILLVATIVANGQEMGVTKRDPLDPLSIDIDPIDKLAPNNKPVSKDDSIAVMTAETVAITADKRDVRKARRLLIEQAKVGELTRELIEQVKFQFEPYYCRYKTEYRSEGFLGMIRCYGGRFVTSLAPIPLSNQQYREVSNRVYGNSYGSGYGLVKENSYTDFDIEDIHEDPDCEDEIMFDIVIHAPITIDSRTEYNLKYHFTLNFKNGKMACVITGEYRKYASYYGYLTDLR